MKFFTAILLVAFVAVAYAAEEPAAARKLEPVNEAEPSEANTRDKRGFVLSAYTAPVATAAAVEVAAPLTAAYAAPVAYTYSASLPYAYRPYASYYSYPAVYV